MIQTSTQLGTTCATTVNNCNYPGICKTLYQSRIFCATSFLVPTVVKFMEKL